MNDTPVKTKLYCCEAVRNVTTNSIGSINIITKYVIANDWCHAYKLWVESYKNNEDYSTIELKFIVEVPIKELLMRQPRLIDWDHVDYISIEGFKTDDPYGDLNNLGVRVNLT